MTTPEKKSFRRTPVAPVVTADLVGLSQGFTTSVGAINGLWPSAMLAPGPISLILPWLLILTVGVCLGCAWRMIFHHVARERSLVLGGAWVLLAVGLWAACVGTSGRYMAALVDGASAVREHEYAYLRSMEGAVRASANRAAVDQPLIQISASEEHNLRGTQEGERRFGVVSKKAGDKGITDVIGREADAFNGLTGDLRTADSRRSEYLRSADQHLSLARDDAAAGDETGFVKETTEAVRFLKQANGISLLDAVGGFGSGMVIDKARAPFDQAKREVDQFVSAARDKQVAVDIPVFNRMSDKDAVWVYPPVMGWLFAVTLESFPLFMVLGLLLSNLGGHRPMFAPVFE